MKADPVFTHVTEDDLRTGIRTLCEHWDTNGLDAATIYPPNDLERLLDDWRAYDRVVAVSAENICDEHQAAFESLRPMDAQRSAVGMRQQTISAVEFLRPQVEAQFADSNLVEMNYYFDEGSDVIVVEGRTGESLSRDQAAGTVWTSFVESDLGTWSSGAGGTWAYDVWAPGLRTTLDGHTWQCTPGFMMGLAEGTYTMGDWETTCAA